MEIADLPHLNATLNAISFVLLTAGFVAVKKGNVKLHKILMWAALFVSACFLTSYLTYHFNAEPTRFQKEGFIRTFYFIILISHTILAVVIAVLVPWTVIRALRNRIEAHKKMAKWTLPIWMYVCVTGVAVYWMLYRM